MKSAAKKAGRKAQHYVDSNGDPVVGLARRPSDGRWRIISGAFAGQTFTEPDERLAIARFHQLTNGRPERADMLTLHAGREDWPEHDKATSATIFEHNDADQWAEIGVPVSFVYAYVRRQILQNPKRAAKFLGIEEIGYLTNLKPDVPPPSFDELAEIWKMYSKPTDERRRVLTAWQDFVNNSGAKCVADIRPELCVAYRDNVYSRNVGAKYQQHIFARARRVLSFAKSRAIAVDELTRALSYMALLTPNDTTVSLDPKPLAVADWHKLHATLSGDDLALCLVMLNCALYMQEAVNLQWSDIKNGRFLVAHRKKLGKMVRVSVLWPETIAALEAVQRKGEHIFYNREGAPLDVSGATKRFRRMRKAAGLGPDIVASMFRDGAYTAAVAAGVNDQLSKLFVGHRSGIQDNYCKRRPDMVAECCQAVYAEYMGKALPSAVSPEAATLTLAV